MSADRVAHIDGQLMQLLKNTPPALAEYNTSNKNQQPIYECLLGFLFNNITFCAATNFGCIDSFLRPIPETKK